MQTKWQGLGEPQSYDAQTVGVRGAYATGAAGREPLAAACAARWYSQRGTTLAKGAASGLSWRENKGKAPVPRLGGAMHDVPADGQSRAHKVVALTALVHAQYRRTT